MLFLFLFLVFLKAVLEKVNLRNQSVIYEELGKRVVILIRQYERTWYIIELVTIVEFYKNVNERKGELNEKSCGCQGYIIVLGLLILSYD